MLVCLGWFVVEVVFLGSLVPPPLRGGFLSCDFHGLRDVFGVALPVATGLGPFGAREVGGMVG